MLITSHCWGWDEAPDSSRQRNTHLRPSQQLSLSSGWAAGRSCEVLVEWMAGAPTLGPTLVTLAGNTGLVGAQGPLRAGSLQGTGLVLEVWWSTRMILMFAMPRPLSWGSWCGRGAREHTGKHGLGPGPVARELCGCHPPWASFRICRVGVVPSGPSSRGCEEVTVRAFLLNDLKALSIWQLLPNIIQLVQGWNSFFLAHSWHCIVPSGSCRQFSLLTVLHVRTRSHWEDTYFAQFSLTALWGEKKMGCCTLAFQLVSQVINTLLHWPSFPRSLV